jgi:hypothetical protein
MSGSLFRELRHSGLCSYSTPVTKVCFDNTGWAGGTIDMGAKRT